MTILVSDLGDIRSLASEKEISVFRTRLEAALPGITLAVRTDPVGANAIADVLAGAGAGAGEPGTIGWGLPQASGVDGTDQLFGMPFGMRPDEFMSLYYDTLRTVQVAQFAAAPAVAAVPFLIGIRFAEGGGWFKEPISHEMFTRGTYSTGQKVKMRLFGKGQKILNAAYPNVETPAATGGVSALVDFQNDVFTALEFSSPEGDGLGGLFPNSTEGPDVIVRAGSIVEAGATNLYVQPWWQPMQALEVWFQKTWWDGTATAAEKVLIEHACQASVAQQMATSGSNGPILQQFKDIGVVLHDAWPADMLARLSDAAHEVLDDDAAGDGTGRTTAILDEFKTKTASESVRYDHMNAPALDRSQNWPGWGRDTTLGGGS